MSPYQNYKHGHEGLHGIDLPRRNTWSGLPSANSIGAEQIGQVAINSVTLATLYPSFPLYISISALSILAFKNNSGALIIR